MLIVKEYKNKPSKRLTSNVVRVRQLDRGIASAILFLFPYVSLRRRQKHAFMSWITGDLVIVKKCMQYKNKVTKREKGKPIFV